MSDSGWTICLDGAKRIERDGEVVAWLYERVWERLLIALAEAEGTPVFRRDLVASLYGGRAKGGQRLAEACFALKANLHEMGVPEGAVISDRHAIRLGPVLAVNTGEAVAAGMAAQPVGASLAMGARAPSVGPLHEFLSDIPRRNAERCLKLATDAEAGLRGADRQHWLVQLDAAYQRITAALDWALERDEHEIALGIAGAIWPYWLARSKADEGRAFLDRAVFDPGAARGSPLEARCLLGSGALAALAGHLDAAELRLSESLSIWSLYGDREAEARTVMNMGIVAHRRGDFSSARRQYSTALAYASGLRNLDLLISVQHNLALNEIAAEQYSEAERLLQECLKNSQAAGDDLQAARAISSMATLAQRRGETETALRLSEKAILAFAAADDNDGIAFASLALGCTYHEMQRFSEARTLYEASLESAKVTGSNRRIGEAKRYLAALTADEGNRDDAVDLYAQAHELLQVAGDARGVTIVEAALDELEAQSDNIAQEGRET